MPLHVGFDPLPDGERNMAGYIFPNDTARDLYADWAESARSIVGMLHPHAGRHRLDPRLLMHTAELGSPSEGVLRLLASWTADKGSITAEDAVKRKRWQPPARDWIESPA